MRALTVAALALATAISLAACSNRYDALCEHDSMCAAEESATLPEQSCEATLPIQDDAVPDACIECLINLPCDVVNDCLLRKSCHEVKLECAAVCP